MAGLKVPVMAVAGSGNQGITSLLGALAVAEVLGSDGEALGRALAMSVATTVVIKGFTGRVTALCGCSMAAAAGVAAATAYLLGGDFEVAAQAILSTIGMWAGVLCDGARVSCAYKLGAATATAIQSAYLALQGTGIPGGAGILGCTPEETFANLRTLNACGMAETDQIILRLVQKAN